MLTWGGDGLPGLREADGQGGKGFYIARSGRRADLLVFWGEEMMSVLKKGGVSLKFTYDSHEWRFCTWGDENMGKIR